MEQHQVELVSATLVVAVVMLWKLHMAAREKLIVLAAKTQNAVKVGDRFYFVVGAEEMHELLTHYKTDPNRIEQYQVDAAVKWLGLMGAGFYCEHDGEHSHVSTGDLVRAVVKAVREAEK